MVKSSAPHSIFCVDPGTTKSAYAILNAATYHPIQFGKQDNQETKSILIEYISSTPEPVVVIETMISMGARVGSEVFDTCIFIGRLSELAESFGAEVCYINRRQEKLGICGTVKANDRDIRLALINRFACGVPNYGKGTKNQPGWFRGFADDIWSAYCIGVIYIDLVRNGGHQK